MKEDYLQVRPLAYLAPESHVLTLEAGTSVLNNGSLPPVTEEQEEDW